MKKVFSKFLKGDLRKREVEKQAYCEEKYLFFRLRRRRKLFSHLYIEEDRMKFAFRKKHRTGP